MTRIVSRRNVVRIGAVGALGVLAAACQTTPPTPTAAPKPTTAPAPAPTTAPAAPPTTAPAAPATATAAPKPTAAPAATTAPAAPTTAPTAAAAAPTAAPTAAAPAATAAPTAPPKPTAAPTTAAAASGTPRRGGIYRFAGTSSSGIRGLDPGAAEGSDDWWSAGMVLYNFLYFFDHTGKIFPDVAAAMPTISADALNYTIPIRKGIKFHNGREVKAADVKFSLEWQLWPDTYSWGKSYMDSIVGYKDVLDGKTKELSGVKVVDDYTVSVTLNRPQAVFPALLTYSMNGIIPKEETIAAGKDFGQKIVIGTGPFKLKEWVRGQKASYVRHDQYFREGKPYLDGIDLFIQLEPAQAMLRWENNEVEALRGIPPAELPKVRSDAKYKPHLKETLNLGVTKLVMHMKSGPTTNLKIRQAIAHAVDKDNYIKVIGGAAEKREGFYARGMVQFDANFKTKYEFNQDKAKALVKESGVASPKVLMWTGGATAAGPGPQAIQQDLKAVGLDVEFVQGSKKDLLTKLHEGAAHMLLHGWSASAFDAFDYVSAWTTCASIKTGENWMNYCNQKIDALMDTGEKLPINDPKRIQAYREIEDLVINQDVAFIGISHGISQLLSRDYVKDEFLSAIYAAYPYVEGTWMDKK